MQPASSSSATLLENGLSVPADLLKKYDTTGPRYTSYPTAPVWHEGYTASSHRAAIAESNQDPRYTGLPLSIYMHLPFCEARCLFCACNVIITQQRDQAKTYLEYLYREIEMTASRMNTARPVIQYHWGGGTPTYLSPEQMSALFRFSKEHFTFDPDAEIAIEVDPRITTREQIATLRELGFNRVSLGVQDFDATVQEAVHRIQPISQTAAMLDQCRELGFKGINFDLIYGLPHQTPDTFNQTLTEVLAMAPDRIALYNFAHVPWMAPHQKAIDEGALPDGESKFRIFRTALNRFLEAGYIYIGMDHFARPDDELAQALHNNTLHRNFMGYTVAPPADLYGFGVSAISGLQDHYGQNVKKLSQYYEHLDQKSLPTARGLTLGGEDHLRRDIILTILCRGQLDYAAIQAKHGVHIPEHFPDALHRLAPMAQDGLLTLHDSGFTLTPLGRVFSRNIAMPFDEYLPKQQAAEKPTFSKTL
ncbi:MAG: oxygen-independent coproporphyrinogen III oxidase [Candidatus Melainabacteria bacterium]